MRNAAVALLALSSVVLLTACPGDDPDAPPPEQRDMAEPAPEGPPVPEMDEGQLPDGVTMEMVREGAGIFRGSVCVPCHGGQGEGTPLGPSLNDTDWINIEHDYEEIVRIIRDGVDPPQEYPAPMPRMGGAHFSDEQLRALGAYVYALASTGG